MSGQDHVPAALFLGKGILIVIEYEDGWTT